MKQEIEITTRPTRPASLIRFGLVMLGVIILIVIIAKEMDVVRDFIRHSGWIGLLISVGLYGLLGLSPIPSEPLTVLLSTVYGPLTATLVAGTGNLLAAVVEYMIGEHIGNIASFEKRKASLPFGLGRFPVNSVPFLLIARMIPGYGPKFVSLISGIYRVPVIRYLWTAAIPTFVGSALFAYGGFGLFNLYPTLSGH
jgi:uncharacterized membrane protein YdjX (TVP38/TMEM64 family)